MSDEVFKVYLDDEKAALVVVKDEEKSFEVSVLKAFATKKKLSKLYANATWLYVEDGEKLADYIEKCVDAFENSANKSLADTPLECVRDAFFCCCVANCCAISVVPWQDGDEVRFNFGLYALSKKRSFDSCTVDLTKGQVVDLISFLR